MKKDRSTPTEINYHWVIATSDRNIIRNLQEFLISKNFDGEFTPVPENNNKNRMMKQLPDEYASEIINLLLSDIDTYERTFFFRQKNAKDVEPEPVERKHVRQMLKNEEQPSSRAIIEEVGQLEEKEYLTSLSNQFEVFIKHFTGKPMRISLKEKYEGFVSKISKLKGVDRKVVRQFSAHVRKLGYKLSLDFPNNQMMVEKV